MSDTFEQIVKRLKDLKEDPSVPKNVKLKISDIIGILEKEDDKSIKLDKIVHIFDELNEDSNIDSYTRTQLWNIASMLESLD